MIRPGFSTACYVNPQNLMKNQQPQTSHDRRARSRFPFMLAISVACFALFPEPPSLAAMQSSESETPYFDMPFGRDYEVAMRQRITDQIETYLRRYTDQLAAERSRHWNRDLSSAQAYAESVKPNRKRLRHLVGAVDARVAPRMEYYGESSETAGKLAETDSYTVHAIRWPVLGEISGEGILLMPKGEARAGVVAIPDADQRPETLLGWDGDSNGIEPFAARLAGRGVVVVVPAIVSREMRYGQEGISAIPVHDWLKENDALRSLRTNLSNREILWRQSYLMGRHLIGYELQRIYAALDWLESEFGEALPLGLAGYGEGGLLALYGAALEPRVRATLVSGYFGPREQLSQEPTERLVWELLKEFGDAEIGGLIAPRGLVIEYSMNPDYEVITPLPPGPDAGQLDWFENMALKAAGKGAITTPPFEAVDAEVQRLRGFFAEAAFDTPLHFVHGAGGSPVDAGSKRALDSFCELLGVQAGDASSTLPVAPGREIDAARRQHRIMDDVVLHLMEWMRRADFEKYRYFQGDYTSPAAWDRSMEPYREALYAEIVGKLPDANDPPPLNLRKRQVYEAETWSGYEVVYDAVPGVWGFGVLAVPKDIPAGERRPVVFVQHGYDGMPGSYTRDGSYRDLMSRLCERGFVVFGAHLAFNADMKNAVPVGATVFSFGVPQYQQAIRWLKQLEYVDADRMGYYGLSYGGRSALYLPPLIQEFKFTVSSASFGYWPGRGLRIDSVPSAIYHERIGPFKFGLGTRFGQAELALMIAPRGFMVENGYYDTAVVTEQAGHEYAKIQRVYDLLGIGDRVKWGAHIGGHEVHLDTLLPYIHRMLDHPVPATGRVSPPSSP